MIDQNPAVIIKNVKKDFYFNAHQHNSLKHYFTGFFKKTVSGTNIQHALSDINLTINDGEFFGIVGRNGSGKSTLLKIIAGIYQPNSGRVQVGGRLVPFIELGVGFNPELTGRENVYLNGALLGFSEKEIASMYSAIVSFAELEDHMEKKLKNYSSGMQVRLAFSLAIRAEADILLVDEVLAVGDAAFKQKCYDYFLELKKKKTTVILVTHDMNIVKKYCTRAALIENSHIKIIGDTKEIAKKYDDLFNVAAL